MIHARGLTRRFKIRKGSVDAVRGLDIDVEEGQLVAFLGPNGAGKSTSLRMLTSLLPPTSGTATVAGCDVVSDPAGVRARIGYVGQKNSAGENFRVRDELVTQARCYGLRRAGRGGGPTRSSACWTWKRWPPGSPAPCRAASAAASTSPWGSSTGPVCFSWTSPRPASTRRAAPTSGSTSCGCARNTARPSF